MSLSILVTGATGNQGGAVVKALLKRGRRVRALVRDPTTARATALAASGIELFVGDLTDCAAVTAAMTGASSAFALTTPGRDPQQEVRQGASVIEAAGRARLPHLVLASVASAQEAPFVPHFASKARIEELAAHSGVPATVLAPTWFFENVVSLRGDILAGILPLAVPPARRLQAVAVADLGSLVATVMEAGDALAGQRIEVAGDELTPTEMARTLTAVTGVTVTSQEVPLAELEQRSHDLAAMYQFLATTGYAVDIAALRATFADVGWHTFAEWAASQPW